MTARVELDQVSVRARPGARISNDDAAAIAPQLFAIEQRDGHITAEAILADASHPESPLHRFFEWDDAKAAQQQRLATARTLARSVCYRVKVLEGNAARYQPMFVRLRQSEDERPTYMSVTRALAAPDLRDQLLANARRELESWIRRFKTLDGLAHAMELAEQLAEEVRRVA